eukprot:Seg2589.1 transcript_id=Seg2589.1/GoldUCD/mRNA.D3Y31 product=Fucolectin-5 protein_id=Seg2589.1/GoldUCD/D3Y31
MIAQGKKISFEMYLEKSGRFILVLLAAILIINKNDVASHFCTRGAEYSFCHKVEVRGKNVKWTETNVYTAPQCNDKCDENRCTAFQYSANTSRRQQDCKLFSGNSSEVLLVPDYCTDVYWTYSWHREDHMKKTQGCCYFPKGDKAVQRYQLTGNLARGQPTSQSSTSNDGISSRAVDGNLAAVWTRHSCTHTTKETNPWWRVDLQSDYQVARVDITNRDQCCCDRLKKVQIRVGNTDDDPQANALCVSQDQPFGCGETKELNCESPTLGRFVFVTLRTTDYLTLCEVEVLALTCNMNL